MNIVDPLHAHARSRPDDWAVITPQQKLSWAMLDDSLWSAALRFKELGFEEGDRVGLTIQHPLMHLVWSLGLARIGVAHAAIPFTDPPSTRAEFRKKLGLKAIFCDSEKLHHPETGSVLVKKLSVVPVDAAQRAELAATGAEGTWLFLQSSGTTGAPKFAELTHSDAAQRSRRYEALFKSGEKDVFWPVSRLDFVVAKQRSLYALRTGAALSLPVGLPLSPEIVPFLQGAGITLACGTPSHLHQLLALAELKPLPSLRAFEVRSATISEKLRNDFKQRVSPSLHVVYGTNEGDALAAASPALQEKVPHTVGIATPSIVIEVVDFTGNRLAPGATGEVRARGPGVVTQYFENREASARSFREGWFYPGDLGFLTPEGALVLQGRKDDMMIFDGMNIYPAEIENALLAHPAVKEAAAYPLKHERFQDVPVAAVITQSPVTETELIHHCRNLIGIRHPKRIFFAEDFPRNSMGKVLKRELASLK